MLLISLLNFSVLLFYAPLDWRAMLVAYLGLLLWGGTMMALGGFISTTTTNQIVAGSISFGLFLLLFVLVWAQTQPLLISNMAIVLMGVVVSSIIPPALISRAKPMSWADSRPSALTQMKYTLHRMDLRGCCLRSMVTACQCLPLMVYYTMSDCG